MMITIVGTGHVFDISSKILQLVEEKDPDVICIELDEKRYHSLLVRETNPRELPLAYRILSRLQRRIAEWHGVRAGEEMIAAINAAKERDIPLELIDMDAEEVFKRFWKTLSFGEKIKLIFYGVLGLMKSRSSIEKEIEGIENRIDETVEEVGKIFPSLKKVLIDERNRYMAERLEKLSSKYDKILVFVGDGHVAGIESILRNKNIDVETIRLKDLKSDISFSFTVDYGPVA